MVLDSKNEYTFVHTNIVHTIMNIESVIKNSQPLPLPSKTYVNMVYTCNLLEEIIANTLKPYGISQQQYNVLRILRGQKGNPANLGTINERMIHKSSNTTRLIDKLIQKGLVNRQVCEKNRRKIEVFITEEGNKLLETLDPIIEKNNTDLVGNLSEKELQTLNKLLDKLRNE